jgi:DNA-binding NarL/FixJ family response regulator
LSFTDELHTKLRCCASFHVFGFRQPSVTSDMAREVAVVVARHVFTLTPREQQIVTALMRGDTARQIADAHGLGRQTVKNYLTTIYEKLGVTGRMELRQSALDGSSAAQHL